MRNHRCTFLVLSGSGSGSATYLDRDMVSELGTGSVLKFPQICTACCGLPVAASQDSFVHLQQSTLRLQRYYAKPTVWSHVSGKHPVMRVPLQLTASLCKAPLCSGSLNFSRRLVNVRADRALSSTAACQTYASLQHAASLKLKASVGCGSTPLLHSKLSQSRGLRYMCISCMHKVGP